MKVDKIILPFICRDNEPKFPFKSAYLELKHLNELQERTRKYFYSDEERKMKNERICS